MTGTPVPQNSQSTASPRPPPLTPQVRLANDKADRAVIMMLPETLTLMRSRYVSGWEYIPASGEDQLPLLQVNLGHRLPVAAAGSGSDSGSRSGSEEQQPIRPVDEEQAAGPGGEDRLPAAAAIGSLTSRQSHQAVSRRVRVAVLGRARQHDASAPASRRGAGASRGAAAPNPAAEPGAPPMAAKRPRVSLGGPPPQYLPAAASEEEEGSGSLGGFPPRSLPDVPLLMTEGNIMGAHPAVKMRKEVSGSLGELSLQTPLPAVPLPMATPVEEDTVAALPAAKRPRRPDSLGLSAQPPPAAPPSPPAKRLSITEPQEQQQQRGGAPVAGARRRPAVPSDPPVPTLAPAQDPTPLPSFAPASAPTSAPAPTCATAPPPAPASALASAPAPAACLQIAPLRRLAEAVQRSASGSVGSEGGSGSGGVTLAYNIQQVLVAAIHVCFGQSMLEEPLIREMLLSQTLERCTAAQSLLLPLLVGAVSVLPDEEVAEIQRGIGGMSPGEGGGLLQTRVQLLVWALCAGCSEMQDGPSSCRPMQEAILMVKVRFELVARVKGMGDPADPTPVLQAAFREVLKQQPVSEPHRALVAVAACLAHAQQGRVGDEEGSAEAGVIGQLMRLVGRAMDVEGGGGFSALAAATRAMQAQGKLPEPSSVPDAVTSAAFVSIKEALPDLEGQDGMSLEQLFMPAITLGVALHSAGFADLVEGIRMALVLAYGPAWRLPLQVAAAVVSESMAPAGPQIELVMRLMGEMRGMMA